MIKQTQKDFKTFIKNEIPSLASNLLTSYKGS